MFRLVRAAAVGTFLAAVGLGCENRREEKRETALGDRHLSRVHDITFNDGANDWWLIVWGEPSCAARWDASAVAAAKEMAHPISSPVSLSNADVDGDGVNDESVMNPETRTLVIWDGSSIPGDEAVEVFSVLDDLDGDTMPELWIRRATMATTLYSASGLGSTRAREPRSADAQPK